MVFEFSPRWTSRLLLGRLTFRTAEFRSPYSSILHPFGRAAEMNRQDASRLLAPFPLLTALATFALSPSIAPAQQPARERIVIQAAQGDEHVFRMEIADDQYEILRGLTLRTSLPADEGMLFVFSESSERSFWMRNTFIELDILFLTDDGRISHIHHNAVPGDPSGIPSRGPISRVVEINGGLAATLGIGVGDVARNPRYFHPR